MANKIREILPGKFEKNLEKLYEIISFFETDVI